MDAEKIRQYLRQIIKIRAVQQLSASQALCFVFQLKQAVRAELAEAVKEPWCFSELAKLDGRIDQIALASFDVFVQCREQVCELRVNEVKRQVSWIMGKIGERGLGSQLAQINLDQ